VRGGPWQRGLCHGMGVCVCVCCYKARLEDKWGRSADWGRVGRPIREADEMWADRRRGGRGRIVDKAMEAAQDWLCAHPADCTLY
jgi:hypothetical protein